MPRAPAVRAAVGAMRPAAVVVDAVNGRVPPALLFPADPDAAAGGRATPGGRALASDRFETSAGHPNGRCRCPGCRRRSERLAPKLARAKGCSRPWSSPAARLLFQLAGGRATLGPAGARPLGLPPVRIVFVTEIGAVSAGEIRAAMETALAG